MSTPFPTADSQNTYVVELTPPGRAAVAVVLVSGPHAVRTVSECFVANSNRSLKDAVPGRILVGRWGGSSGEDLVVCRRSDNEVEIHTHGGSAAVRAVLDVLTSKGCCQITWRDWLRCPRNRVSQIRKSESRRDSTTCDAQVALADAVTGRTAAILLDQLNGALSNAISEALATVAAADWRGAARLIDKLLARQEFGLHLTAPWRVVFAGPPNVGKSSLINALAGYERAIVSPVPGTTRDVVTVLTAIDGWPVLLADTAGLRATGDVLESAGVELAQTAVANADLAILVEDATAPHVGWALPTNEVNRAGRDKSGGCLPYVTQLPSRLIRVRNKIDLAPHAIESNVEERSAIRTMVDTSALTGDGIPELAFAIASSLAPNPPVTGEAVPFTTAQIEALVVARNAIQRRHADAATEALQSLLAAKMSDGDE
jgi:tRNA modification GTPase